MIARCCLALLLSLPLGAVELEFSTFYGGEFGEQANDVALDADGNVYIVGQTRDLPAAPGSLSNITGTSFDIFVLKLNPTGTEVLYFAVFGGSGRELGTGIEVDAAGSAYVTGWTFSTDFPVTPGAAQTTFGGGSRDAFAAKLTPDGSAFEYATFIGGSTFEDGSGIGVDAQGRAVVVGTTGSSDFLTTPGALELARPVTTRSAFLTRLSADGSTFEWSALVGGSDRDEARAVALDADGSAWIAGYTTSTDFPVTAGAYQSELRGSDDAYVAHIHAEGTAILAATRLGGAICTQPLAGSPCDVALAITLDAGNPVVAGNTLAPDFPVTYGSAWAGGTAFGDAFAARLNRSLTTLQLSTLIGGSSEDSASGVTTDLSGAIYLSGSTGSRNFPTTENAIQRELGALDEVFLAEIDPDSGALLYSTLMGGLSGDRGFGITSNQRGTVVVTGETGSATFPSTPGVVQPDLVAIRTEGGDAFVAQFRFEPQPRLSTAGVVNAASLQGGVVSPGQIVSLFGRAIGPESPLGLRLESDRVATTLADVRVLVNGTPAPLLFVGLNQINAVIPYDAAFLPVATLQVERSGFRSAPITLRVEQSSPALFVLDGSGVGQGAILNQDFSVNGGANPARRGEIVVLYATGEGPTTPGGVDGLVAGQPLPRPAAEIRVSIDGINSEVLYAGGAPGLVAGVMQINVRIPATARSGAAMPVSFTAAGRRSRSGVTLAIE